MESKALQRDRSHQETALPDDRSEKVTPFLLFDGQAEEAALLYVSLLPDSQIDRAMRWPADTPSGPAGVSWPSDRPRSSVARLRLIVHPSSQ